MLKATESPLLLATVPPPQAVIPTLIRLIPISVTTIPETNGVMILRVYFNKRLINISTVEAAIQAPKITGRPPVSPAEMIGPMKEKLVPLYAQQSRTDTSDSPTLYKRGHAGSKQCHGNQETGRLDIQLQSPRR